MVPAPAPAAAVPAPAPAPRPPAPEAEPRQRRNNQNLSLMFQLDEDDTAFQDELVDDEDFVVDEGPVAAQQPLQVQPAANPNERYGSRAKGPKSKFLKAQEAKSAGFAHRAIRMLSGGEIEASLSCSLAILNRPHHLLCRGLGSCFAEHHSNDAATAAAVAAAGLHAADAGHAVPARGADGNGPQHVFRWFAR